MTFSKINSRGEEYWLHRVLGKNKRYIYFFSKSSEEAIDLPEGYYVDESPMKSRMPILRKRKVI